MTSAIRFIGDVEDPVFVSGLSGILMRIEEDEVTRYRYEVWFDYTRETMNSIAEGAMIAVPNFAGNDRETHSSILEVAGIMPVHYALGDDIRGYPGFVLEAARNAGQDWVTQDHASTEDTTKIRCIAIPTNLEIVEAPFSTGQQEPEVQEERNLPMVGHEARLLDGPTTERIANLALDIERDNVIQVGVLVRDPGVRAFLAVEELIKVHFGIFGFTGAGKSNLVSTLVRKLLIESKEPVKIVIFDLMSEYTGLLIDLIAEIPGRIVNLGTRTAPQSLLDYYASADDKGKLALAAEQYLRTSLLPRGLKAHQSQFVKPIEKLIQRSCIRFYQPREKVLGEIIESIKPEVLKGNLGNSSQAMRNFIQDLIKKYKDVAPDEAMVNGVIAEVDDFQAHEQDLKTTALNNLDTLRRELKSAVPASDSKVPARAQVTVPQIIEKLNEIHSRSLIIFQAHDPDELREFAGMLISLTYEARRKTGQITPPVSFVFDEADEFIPGQPTSDSQKATKAAAMSLARRGRKFGLGLGIATQRIRYLDTSILAQPHTYFVSKLPRQSDRQAIAEAFGFSEDMFRQTFKFKKGDWLLASYDAAGLEAIPIPIHAEDANQRILSFVMAAHGTAGPSS